MELPKSGSFNYKSKRTEQGFCEAIRSLLFSTREVIDDAHCTFIKDIEEDEDR